jgi:hypothetical protein
MQATVVQKRQKNSYPKSPYKMEKINIRMEKKI